MSTPVTNITSSSDNVLSNAISKIEELATRGLHPEVVKFEVVTGRPDETITLPIVFLPDRGGQMLPHSLAKLQAEAVDLANKRRLSTAKGPDERTGTAKHETLESFCAHVNHFKDAENSVVWAARDPAPRLVAVFDYHEKGTAGTPRWGRHRAAYNCPLSEEWSSWGGGKAVTLTQEELGAFLQAHDMDLTEGSMKPVHGGPERRSPSASFMLNMANDLEINSSTTVSRKVDANTGKTMLQFTEQSGVTGSVTPPQGFLIHIPILADAEAQTMEVRLAVRIPKGAAQALFTLQIHSADRLLREAFSKVVDSVRVSTGLLILQGTPEE